MTRHMTRFALFFAAMALSSAVLPDKDGAPDELNQAQRLVFMADHLHDVVKGSVLNYDFTSHRKDEEGVTDNVKVTVTEVLEDKTRNLEFDFLSGDNHIEFTPAVGYTGNPVIIHFLERDIRHMARDTGGSSSYFRNGIRRSFSRPLVQPIKIAFQGKQLDATEVVVQPFVADPNIDRFAAYANKRYEFIFSKHVPGGVYRIHTLVPGAAADEAYIEEELTFSGLSPAG